MSHITWTESFSVGNTTMDDHHKKLFDIINELYDAMLVGKGKQKTLEVMGRLKDYTVFHFTEEEKLMDKASYPGIADQKKAHKEFISKIEEFQKKIDEGKITTLSIDTSSFLNNWLRNHIQKMDKAYTEYLK